MISFNFQKNLFKFKLINFILYYKILLINNFFNNLVNVIKKLNKLKIQLY